MAHKTTSVRVWVDVDEGIAPLVWKLDSFPGIRTHASCQGTENYGPYVMISWKDPGWLARVLEEFDVEVLGESFGYTRPKQQKEK